MTIETHEFTPTLNHTIRLQDTDMSVYYDDETGEPYAVFGAYGEDVEPVTVTASEMAALIQFWGTYGRKVQTT